MAFVPKEKMKKLLVLEIAVNIMASIFIVFSFFVINEEFRAIFGENNNYFLNRISALVKEMGGNVFRNYEF